MSPRLTNARARSPRRAGYVLPALLAIGTALLWQSGAVRGQAGEAHLALNATGTGVTCDVPTEPQQCTVPSGGTFTLAVGMVHPPAGGYIAIQTQLYLDGFTWTPGTSEEENVWPDNRLPVRSPNSAGPGVTVVTHGGLTSLSQPFTASHYEGNVVEVHLTCSPQPRTAQVALVAYDQSASPLGTEYSLPDLSIVGATVIGSAEIDVTGDGTANRVPVADILMITCGAAPSPQTTVEALPAYTPGAAPQPGQTPGVTSAPGTTGTPSAGGTPRTAVSTTATPGGTGAGKSNGGGNSTWIIIVVVVAAVAVLGAGGGYWWYIRHRSAS